MTYREKFYISKHWEQKVLIVELFHLLKLSKDSKWRIADTARYFKISIGLVSENLKLAKAIQEGRLDDCKSRQKAIKKMRSL